MPDPDTPYQESPNSNFRDQVIRGIARLEIQSAMIVDRLDKINGAVAHTQHRVNVMEVDLTAHPLTCANRMKLDEIAARLDRGEHPGAIIMQQRLTSLEGLALENKARMNASLTWVKYLLPIIYLAISGITLMILLHAKDLLNLRFGIVK